jgi:hypothetical protein
MWRRRHGNGVDSAATGGAAFRLEKVNPERH